MSAMKQTQNKTRQDTWRESQQKAKKKEIFSCDLNKIKNHEVLEVREYELTEYASQVIDMLSL